MDENDPSPAPTPAPRRSRMPLFLAAGGWGRKFIVGLAVVVAFIAYNQNQLDNESDALLAELKQSEADRKQNDLNLKQAASCVAVAMSRGAQPATAVNGCASGSMVDNAVYFSNCLESGIQERGELPTADDVEFYWLDCIGETQLQNQQSEDGY